MSSSKSVLTGDDQLSDADKESICYDRIKTMMIKADEKEMHEKTIAQAFQKIYILCDGKEDRLYGNNISSVYEDACIILNLYDSLPQDRKAHFDEGHIERARELYEERDYPMAALKEFVVPAVPRCAPEDHMLTDPKTDEYSELGSLYSRVDRLAVNDNNPKKKRNYLDWNRKRAPAVNSRKPAPAQSSNNGVPGMISTHQTPTSSNAPNSFGPSSNSQHGHGQATGFLGANGNQTPASSNAPNPFGTSSHGQQTGNGQATGFFGANGNQTQSSGFAGAGNNQTPSNNGGHGQGQAMGPPGARFDFSTPCRAEQGAPLSTASSSGHQNPINPSPGVSTRVYTNLLFFCLISHFSLFLIAVCFWWRRTKYPPQLFELHQWWH